MCSPRLGAALLALAGVALAGAAGAAGAPSGSISEGEAAEILRRADVASQAPESFRARLRITSLGEPPGSMEVEVWCSGESRSLVRFLGPKEKGKYLLRLDSVLWFLAPGARKPVKVSPAHRLAGGASLDEILGIRYTRDYRIDSASVTAGPQGEIVQLDLAAAGARAPYPRVRYFVRRATGRPVRAEYLLSGGKLLSVVEFLEWAEGSRPVVRRLRLTERLRARPPSEVTLLEMEERRIPEGLFDPGDAAERRKLEASDGS